MQGLLGQAHPQNTGLALEDGVSEVQEILAGFGLDSEDAALAAGVGPVGADQV